MIHCKFSCLRPLGAGRVFVLMLTAALLAAVPMRVAAETYVPAPDPTEDFAASGIYNVMDYGAVGDGETDDTEAIQKALDAASANGGGTVRLPARHFMIETHLTIPANTTLEGIWESSMYRIHNPDVPLAGTVLLAVENKGTTEGTPFIAMRDNTVLKGVTVYYPEQIISRNPHPYPWCVQGQGNNVTIIECLLMNPYMAIDFGTYAHGRHQIRDVGAQPLYKGLYVNQCYDVGRVENVHFWPYWSGPDLTLPICDFMREEGTAFIIGRTDGEMMVNVFSIYYKIGMHFVNHGAGGGSGFYTNCYMDITPTAVKVDEVQANSGISFVNGAMMGTVEVGMHNPGPVKFTGTGFWGPAQDRVADLRGKGAVMFEGCHFSGWGRDEDRMAPCIDANNPYILVSGNSFDSPEPGQVEVRLGHHVRAAIVTDNLINHDATIIDETVRANVQIAGNMTNPPRVFPENWVVVGPFPNPGAGGGFEPQRSREGFDTDYLESIGGEEDARLEPGMEFTFTNEEGEEVTVEAKEASPGYNGQLSFRALFNKLKSVGYAFTYIESDRDQTATFEFASNDCGKVWVNGEVVNSYWNRSGRGSSPGNDMFDVELKKGLNPVLLKAEDSAGSAWGVFLEVYGEDGEPLPSTINP